MNSNPNESPCVDKFLPTLRLFRLGYAGILLIHIFCFSGSLLAGGLTILTHGYQPEDNPDDVPERLVWLDAMTNYVHDKTALTGAVYELVIDKPGGVLRAQLNYIKGPKLDDPANSSGEVIIKLNWALAAGLVSPSGDEAATGEIAAMAFNQLINWSDGSSPLYGPIHLIGHSRGGSVVGALARLLGLRGIWTDHLTTLDPQPVTTLGDEPMIVWETINFADNYYELSATPHGEEVYNAYNRRVMSTFVLDQGGYAYYF